MENANIKLGDKEYLAALCFCVRTRLDFDCAKLAKLIGVNMREGVRVEQQSDHIGVPYTYRIYIPSYCEPEFVVNYLVDLEREIESALDNIDVLKVLKKGIATRR